ncbi:MAG: SEL1-like repeat protein [Akkermansia sp.]|nr:SEL1-like repeat protein [Akkermansia sp.]
MIQVISVILGFIGLAVAAHIYNSLESKAKENNREEAVALYLREMREVPLPDNVDGSLHVPSDVLRFSEEYLPLLHSKWEQILGEYAVVSKNVALMDAKRKRLAELNELSENKVDCSRSAFYEKWKSQQQSRLKSLEKWHQQILSSVETYYAEAQVRNIDSDEDVQRQVAGLIRGANAVLGEFGENAESVTEPADDAVSPASEVEMKPSPADGDTLSRIISRLEKEGQSAPGEERLRSHLLALLQQIHSGGDIDMALPDTKGNRALHYACAIGDMELAEWLLDNGADPTAKTEKGYSPMWCIGTKNRSKLVNLLQGYIKKNEQKYRPDKAAEQATPQHDDSPEQAANSNAEADYAEGLEWQFGRNGRQKNDENAVACYRRAAEQGHAAAQNNLGHMYHQGWGISRDLKQASHWYRLAAEQGNAFGQSNYGTCLEFGWGVSANKAEAIEWYRKAARQGHASAQKHLRRLGVGW